MHSNSDVFIKGPFSVPDQTIEYSTILDYYGVNYNIVDYYLEVGEIMKVQG